MLASGLESITSVMTFLEGNTTFSIMIGVAVAAVVVSAVLGLFFRR